MASCTGTSYRLYGQTVRQAGRQLDVQAGPVGYDYGQKSKQTDKCTRKSCKQHGQTERHAGKHGQLDAQAGHVGQNYGQKSRQTGMKTADGPREVWLVYLCKSLNRYKNKTQARRHTRDQTTEG